MNCILTASPKADSHSGCPRRPSSPTSPAEDMAGARTFLLPARDIRVSKDTLLGEAAMQRPNSATMVPNSQRGRLQPESVTVIVIHASNPTGVPSLCHCATGLHLGSNH